MIVVFVGSTGKVSLPAFSQVSLSLPLLEHTEFACFFYYGMLLRRPALQMAWWVHVALS